MAYAQCRFKIRCINGACKLFTINIQLCDGIRKMFIWNECVRVVICWALTLSSSFPIAMQIHPILIKFSISYWSEIPLAGWFMSNGHGAVLRWIRWFVYICNRTSEYFVQTKKICYNIPATHFDTFEIRNWDVHIHSLDWANGNCSHWFSQWKLSSWIRMFTIECVMKSIRFEQHCVNSRIAPVKTSILNALPLKTAHILWSFIPFYLFLALSISLYPPLSSSISLYPPLYLLVSPFISLYHRLDSSISFYPLLSPSSVLLYPSLSFYILLSPSLFPSLYNSTNDTSPQ